MEVGQSKGSFLDWRQAVVIQDTPMIVLINLVLNLFKRVKVVLHFLLFGVQTQICASKDLFICVGLFYKTRNISRNEVLNLERQVLFQEVIRGSHNSKIVICSHSYCVYLLVKIVNLFPEFTQVNFVVKNFANFCLIPSRLFKYGTDKSLHFSYFFIKILDSIPTLWNLSLVWFKRN